MARIFGPDNVRTFFHKALDNIPLSKSTKTTLVDVGLPHNADLMLTFDFDKDNLPTLEEYARSHGFHAPKTAAMLFRIGTDYGTQICIDPHKNDAVVAIDIEGTNIPDRFVNSSVQQFIESLITYYKFKGSGIGLSEEKVTQLILREEEELRKVDEKAFENYESWWPLIVEQMKDRLL